MKKRFLFVAVCFCFALSGCGKGENVADNADETVTGVNESDSVKTEEKEEEFDMDKLLTLPAGYKEQASEKGTVVKLEYEAKKEAGSDEIISKFAYVYLPYGYDENKKYNILYTLHGGEGDITAYLGTDTRGNAVKNTIDNMIYNKDIEPMIVVSPTYYIQSSDGSNMGVAISRIENFCQHELIYELIPAVEGKYSTYAESTDEEGLKASRDHRAYTGFSMGSLSTWYTFKYNLDYFAYFMPMSGDCWVDGQKDAPAAARMLEQVCVDKGYSGDDFFVFAVTGDKDIAYDAMDAQIRSMKLVSPSFKFISSEQPDGNICFKVQPGATHSFEYLPLYLYNGVPNFFKK